eukprot:1938614-Pyramimonas_sp.AAC.1
MQLLPAHHKMPHPASLARVYKPFQLTTRGHLHGKPGSRPTSARSNASRPGSAQSGCAPSRPPLDPL